MASLDSVNYKITQAVFHFKELERELQGYFETNPGKVVRQPGGDPCEFVGKFQARGPIPARFPLIIGDCLQNLRSSLDYLVWELVLAANNEPNKNNMFPICSTVDAFKTQLSRGRLNGVVDDAAAEIEGLQPYHGGKDFFKTMLWVLDDLCNINKHRRVLLTELVGTPSDIEPQIIGGELWAEIDFRSIDRDATIGPFPIISAPKDPGVELQTEIRILALVTLDEGPAKSMDVGVFLNEMMRYISAEVMPRFERFFVA